MKGRKSKAHGQTGTGVPSARTAVDRARDRKIFGSSPNTTRKSGPTIIRLERRTPLVEQTSPPQKSETGKAKRKATKSKGKAKKQTSSPVNVGTQKTRNPALADALISAGVKVPSKPSPPSKASKQKSKARKPAEKRQEKATSKRRIKKDTPSKRQARFLAEMRSRLAEPRGKMSPSELHWCQRQEEITKLIERIEEASFTKLATEWSKHVTSLGYIRETGRNVDREPVYNTLIEAIENEWGRRLTLNFNSDRYFDWPSTRAGRNRGGDVEVNWAQKGMLSYLGYRVGESSGLADLPRQAILRRAFKMVLPPLESPKYVRSWGSPTSEARLKKMADSLASFTKLAKRKNARGFALAIKQWEMDLAMLREEFYVAKFGFGWPRS